MKQGEESNRLGAGTRTYAGAGRFVPARVHLSEVMVGTGGALMLAALLFSWSEGSPAAGALSLVKLLVVIIGGAAVAVPLVVALNSQTNLPMAWETLLSGSVTLLVPVLIATLLLPPEGGLGSGFFIALAGSVLTVVAGWRSVAREY